MINISQPPFIPANVTGLMGFWQSGVKATGAHLLYAVHALDADMTEAEFVSCARAQSTCLDFIFAETNSVGSFLKDAGPSARSAISIFRHDVLSHQRGVVNAWLTIPSQKKSLLPAWIEHIKSLWGPSPEVDELLRGIVNARLPDRSERDVECYVESHETVRFRSREMTESARVIFENLVENGIKYSREGGGTILIFQEGARITYSDDGIGMDPDFAKRLGGEERLREGRAEGVKGSGIGWTSIGRLMRELGWTWTIGSVPGKGTTVVINLKDGDLVPVGNGADVPEYKLSPGQLITSEDLFRGAELFVNAAPFSGYREISGDQGRLLDVTGSPLWPFIECGARLMRLLRRQ